jgi:hypothetical protein
MRFSPQRAVVTLSAGLCCLVTAACSDLVKNSDLLKKPPSDEAVAAKARVITCEWKAADQYDNDHYKTLSEIAQRVMDACAAQLRDARSASGSSPDDTRTGTDELNQAIQIIGNARIRRKTIPGYQ